MRSFAGVLIRKGLYMKPNNRVFAGLAFAAVCLTAIAVAPVARAQMNANEAELITNGPQVDPGDARGAQSGMQNVRDSARYESAVRSNPTFRATRERKECGPIGDPQLHADCLASFGR
jgi:hypothetical protein